MITGATGFLGARVLQCLADRKEVGRIVVAIHKRGQSDLECGRRIELVSQDLTGDIRLPAGITTVIHVAGEKFDRHKMQAVNCVGTQRLAEAAARAGVRRLVLVSSVGVYGAPLNAGLVTESFPHSPTGPYEVSKNDGEIALRDAGARLGLEYVIVQPSNVIAIVPGRRYPLLSLIRMIDAGFFSWFGRGDGWVNYVDAGDAAEAIVTAAAKAPSGLDYIINCPAPLQQVVRWITDESRIEFPRRRLPAWTGLMAARIGSAISRVSGRSMPFDTGRFRELTNDTRFDPSRLIQTTGYVYPLGAEVMFRGLAGAYLRDTVV